MNTYEIEYFHAMENAFFKVQKKVQGIDEDERPSEFKIENKKPQAPKKPPATKKSKNKKDPPKENEKQPETKTEPVSNPFGWNCPDFNAFKECSTVEQVKKKLEEIKKKVEAEFINISKTSKEKEIRYYQLLAIMETLRQIDLQMQKAKRIAMQKAVEMHKLLDTVKREARPANVNKIIDRKISDLIKNVWTITCNLSLNYTAMTYLDPAAGFAENEESKMGWGFQIKIGHFSNPKQMYGFSIIYNHFWAPPKATTLLQLFTLDGEPVIPETLISKQVMLEPLKEQHDIKFRCEFRNYFLSFFALNPFIQFVINNADPTAENLSLALNALFSFDKERNFVVGIQPIVQWKKNELDKYDIKKPSVGIALYLTKTFKLNRSPYERGKNDKKEDK
jgi:hypothetical protein